MSNQNNRSVSTILRVGIFFIPLVFSWFTLRKGYSGLAKIVSFSWLILMLYASYPMAKESAKEVAQSVAILFGFPPDHIKAQQCLTASRFLSEDEASIWREASEKRINYWLKTESGCSDRVGCTNVRQALSIYVELRSAPNENNVDIDILKDWINSEYCQTLVASYKTTLADVVKTTPQLKETVAPEAVAPAPVVVAQETITPNTVRVKLYFKQVRDGSNKIYEAVDFQEKKEADFCYDSDEFNSIKLEGNTNKTVTLIIENDDGTIFEKKNVSTEKTNTTYNEDIKIEPGPARFQVRVLQDGDIIFQGSVDSYGCS